MAAGNKNFILKNGLWNEFESIGSRTVGSDTVECYIPVVKTTSTASDGSTIVSQANRTISASTVSTSGTVTANAFRVVFELSADFTGTIAGVTRNGATVRSLDFDGGGVAKLNAIAYTRTAGSLIITEYR